MLETKTVRSKAEFFALSRNLVFGNRLRMWSFPEYLKLYEQGSFRKGKSLISVRNTIRGGDSRVQRYRMRPKEALEHCQRLIREGIIKPDQLLLDESAPDDRVTLHAEVMNSERFVELRYALHAGVGMRPAFTDGPLRHAWGAKAVLILKYYLDPSSWDNLCCILEEYRDDMVELSAYSIPVGVLCWNTLFWETRSF